MADRATQVALTGNADGLGTDMRGRHHHLSDRQMADVTFLTNNLHRVPLKETLMKMGVDAKKRLEIMPDLYTFYGASTQLQIGGNINAAINDFMRKPSDPPPPSPP